MPLIQLVCPHCEKTVELNVTSVTLSRDCPQCGRTLVLQKAGREEEGAAPPVLPEVAPLLDEIKRAEAGAGLLSDAPKVLEGDIRRRMLHDPEVQARVKYLRWGSAIVLSLIVVVVLATYFHFWGWAAHGLADIGHHHDKVDDSLPATSSTPVARVTPVSPTSPVIDLNSEPSPPVTLRRVPEKARMFEGLTERKVAPNPLLILPPAEKPPPQTDLDKARETVEGFLNAKSVEERMKYLRSRVAMGPRIRAYYQTHDAGPISYESVESAPGAPVTGKSFQFYVQLPGGDRRKMVVGRAQSGEFLADWASFVIYGEMDWAAFKKAKPPTPVLFRVLATMDAHYGGDFADQANLYCLKMVDPRESDAAPIWAYAEKSSSVGQAVGFALQRTHGESLPLTVTLRYPDAAQSSDQVRLEEFVADGWLANGR